MSFFLHRLSHIFLCRFSYIFTFQVFAQRGLPFQVVLPNEETIAAMKDVRAGKNVETTTVDQLKQDMLFE